MAPAPAGYGFEVRRLIAGVLLQIQRFFLRLDTATPRPKKWDPNLKRKVGSVNQQITHAIDATVCETRNKYLREQTRFNAATPLNQPPRIEGR